MATVINGSTGVDKVQDDTVNPVTDIASGIPCFSAYLSTSQALTAHVSTKLTFNVEEFDTTNAYDNVTSFRFTPQVAGYYKVNAKVAISSATSWVALALMKNGNIAKEIGTTFASANSSATGGEAIIYLNGTTDYIELYGTIGASLSIVSGAQYSYFQAHLIVGA